METLSLLSRILFASRRQQDGGARRDRTDDIVLAKHALSQLSYGPNLGARRDRKAGCQTNRAPTRLS
jgi:hypothetical protein